jgi:hypothetical protein
VPIRKDLQEATAVRRIRAEMANEGADLQTIIKADPRLEVGRAAYLRDPEGSGGRRTIPLAQSAGVD